MSRLLKRLHFLTHNFSFATKMTVFTIPPDAKMICLRLGKRIASDGIYNAPLLHFNYRDSRTVMVQNANGIASNDRRLARVGVFRWFASSPFLSHVDCDSGPPSLVAPGLVSVTIYSSRTLQRDDEYFTVTAFSLKASFPMYMQMGFLPECSKTNKARSTDRSTIRCCS